MVSSSSVTLSIDWFFGMCSRSSRFNRSLVPRSCGAYGWAKYWAISQASISLKPANSLPWSLVIDLIKPRNSSLSFRIALVVARTSPLVFPDRMVSTSKWPISWRRLASSGRWLLNFAPRVYWPRPSCSFGTVHRGLEGPRVWCPTSPCPASYRGFWMAFGEYARWLQNSTAVREWSHGRILLNSLFKEFSAPGELASFRSLPELDQRHSIP